MDQQQPSVGRVVHVRLYVDGQPTSDQCEAATVAYVHSPSTINVGGFDANGHPFSATSVTEDTDTSRTIAGRRWHWPERV